MISDKQIEEWIAEVEQRPSSAPLIIQYISNRLRDLVERNEALLAENIELRSGRKVEVYENRIANLAYQLDLLKRQVGSGELLEHVTSEATQETSLIVYTIDGRAVRIPIDLKDASSGEVVGKFCEAAFHETLPRLLVTGHQEEVLFVFDSGRTTTYPVSAVPGAASDAIDWEETAFVEPRGEEVLGAVLPMATMSLFDHCMQISRRGCVKKMMISAFENHITRGFIGSGVKQKPDQTFSLALTRNADRLMLASHEGYLTSVSVSQAGYTAEEALRLGTTDYLVSAFIPGEKPSLLTVTRNGKAIHREMSWVSASESSKSRGQPVFSQSRRDAGVRVASTAAVDEDDWSIILSSDGQLFLYQIGDLLAAGSIAAIQPPFEVVDFAVFSAPKN